ncbi:MAG: hypothetical protein ACK4J0_00815 [Candidatus Anstonellaceae archaeon]
MVKNSIFNYTLEIYRKKFFIVLFASLPGIFALIIPLAVNLMNKANPIYFSLGAIFLRTGRIIDINLFDFFMLAIPLLLSLYIFSFVLVSINFVVKMQRTLRAIKKEEIKKISSYTNSLFIIFLAVIIIDLTIQLLTYETGLQKFLIPLFRLVSGILILLASSAIVIDEERVVNALKKSYRVVKQKPLMIIQWMLFSLLLLTILDYIILTIFQLFGLFLLAPLVVSLFNFLILVPFLIIMLTQIYISKYTILV